jgi:hypothetical protein
MTIWFAQASNVNIDSANLWNDVANGSGNFLTFANLDPGDILVANNRTGIATNVDFTCLRITTSNADGGTAGGGFVLEAGRTITCNVVAGTTICLNRTAAGDESFIVGDVTGGSANNAFGVNNNSSAIVTITGNLQSGSSVSCIAGRNESTGTLNVNGNVTGGTGAFSIGASNSSGTLNINGNVTGGPGGSADGAFNATGTLSIVGNVTGGSALLAFGVRNNSTGITIITGNVVGGAFAFGAQNISTGTIAITGNVTGGSGAGIHGANNASTGTITITGDAIGGSAASAFGANNASTGTLRVFGLAIGNDHGLGFATNNGVPGVSGFGTNAGTNQAITTVRGIKYGAKGQSPTAGLVQLEVDDLANSFASFRGEPTTFTEYVFGPQEFIGGQPTESDVRFGTEYNFGLRTGTLRVPDPQYVSQGVLTDDTIGTLSVDLQPILDAIQAIDVDLNPVLDKLPTTGRALSDEDYTAPLDSTQTQQAAADAITAAVPANFASLGINSDGHISRVVLVDTTTANTDMRGTDNALLASSYTAPANGDIAAIKAKTDNLPNDPATIAKQDEILGAIDGIDCEGGGVTVNVLPAIGISADRSPGVTLKAFVGETITQSITLYQTNGTTPIVLTGKTLVIVFETRQGQDVATVPNSGITVGGDDDNVVTFNYPSAATSQERVLKFALRDAGSPNTVYLQGLLSVQRAPKVDA